MSVLSSSAEGLLPDAEAFQNLSKSNPRGIARAACCISPKALGYEEDAGEPQPLRVIILPTKRQMCQRSRCALCVSAVDTLHSISVTYHPNSPQHPGAPDCLALLNPEHTVIHGQH